MKLYLVIGFRTRIPQVLPLIPPDLDFLRPLLHQGVYDWSVASANVEVEPEVAERIIAWGREEHNEKSIIRVIRAYDRYELADLDGQVAAEFFHGVGGPQSRSVPNFNKAYRATWACEYCHRVNWEQRAPLELRPPRKYGIHHTWTFEWIVSRQVQEVFARYGIHTRPLANSEEWGQVLLGPKVPVIPDPDAVWIGEPGCHGCSNRTYSRKDWVEGDLLNQHYPGLTLFRHEPQLTLDAETASGLAFARGDILFGGDASGASRPVHEVGSVARVNIYKFSGDGYPCFFASAGLVRELLELKVQSFGFRPVRLASNGSES